MFNKKEELCDYKDCNHKHNCTHTLDLIGEVEGKTVKLPFCEYHRFIVVGGRFTAKKKVIPAIAPTEAEPEGTPEKIIFEVLGPLLEVEMAEQVFGAIEFMKSLKK